MADKFKIKGYNKETHAIDKLRYLLSIVEMKTVNYPDPRLPDITNDELEWMRRECQKAYNFISIHTEYLISYPTAERMYEWLRHYEEYLFGESKFRPRKAVVKISPVLSIKSFYPEYQSSKKKAIKQVTEILRREMQILLEECKKLTQPIVRPYDVGDDIIV